MRIYWLTPNPNRATARAGRDKGLDLAAFGRIVDDRSERGGRRALTPLRNLVFKRRMGKMSWTST